MTDTPASKKDIRLRLGPIAVAALEETAGDRLKSHVLDELLDERTTIAIELNETKKHLEAALRQNKQRDFFKAIFTRMSRLVDTQTTQLEAHSALMLERFRKLDQMHMRTRLLIGEAVCIGEERELVQSETDNILAVHQAYIDELDLDAGKKETALRREMARLQAMLSEASAHENDTGEQLELSDLEQGGEER